VSETAPAKPVREVTVMVEVPELVARILAGETGPVETLKSGWAIVPYTPPTSMIPRIGAPLAASKTALRLVAVVTVSGNATVVPGPATAV
jgi:hypothetical protein